MVTTIIVPVVGVILGAILGAILGVILFWGTIIASVTSYFLYAKQRPVGQIVATIEYNLERIGDLTREELELLKDTTSGFIDSYIKHTSWKPGNLDISGEAL